MFQQVGKYLCAPHIYVCAQIHTLVHTHIYINLMEKINDQGNQTAITKMVTQNVMRTLKRKIRSSAKLSPKSNGNGAQVVDVSLYLSHTPHKLMASPPVEGPQWTLQ